MSIGSFLPIGKYSSREWWAGAVIFLFFLATFRLSAPFFSAPAVFFPASGIALAGLFLEGITLWPFVYAASFAGLLIQGSSLAFLLVMPIGHALQAYVGASLLRRADIDPLFRRIRDMLLFFGIAMLVAAIAPTFGMFANMLNVWFGAVPRPLPGWGPWYTGTLFALIIVSPFLMRWLAKPRFARTAVEVVEIVLIFAALTAIEYFVFFTNDAMVAGIPLVYTMLVPLFWIALRLRPRFITLAILVTALLGISSLFVGAQVPTSELFGTRLFQMELFISIIAAIFFSISALEEDRRTTSNLLKSQVSTLENALSRISSESNAKNDFIAVLAHELRNPLAPIASSVEFLKLQGGRGTDEREALDLMEDRMQVVKRLLDDLLDVSKIAEGKLRLEKRNVELEAIVRSAIASTDHQFKERHQTLLVEPPKERLVLEADPVRVEQIITNLLTNASKYSPSGDRIALSLDRDGTNARIAVRDHGEGIESAMLETIFEPFQQLTPNGSGKKGLGIGLSLVRSFVRMHGGSVRVESEGRGRGSTFMVFLPLSTQEPVRPNKSRPERIERIAGTTAEGPHILVVDDNEAAAWAIGKLLTLQGCTVSFAYDGAEAIKKSGEETFDAVLLDIGLPDQEGYAVAKSMRAKGVSAKIIALTGYSLEEARVRSLDSGFNDYLVKPAGLHDLRRVLNLGERA